MAFLVAGIFFLCFGLYVLFKLKSPHKWEKAEGTVEKKAGGDTPTLMVKVGDKAGWTPYYKSDKGIPEDGERVSVFFYRTKEGHLKVLPVDVSVPYLITMKCAVWSLILAAFNFLAYFIFVKYQI